MFVFVLLWLKLSTTHTKESPLRLDLLAGMCQHLFSDFARKTFTPYVGEGAPLFVIQTRVESFAGIPHTILDARTPHFQTVVERKRYDATSVLDLSSFVVTYVVIYPHILLCCQFTIIFSHNLPPIKV